MRTFWRQPGRAVAVFLAAAGVLGGCTKTFYVTRYPEFYTDQLKAIAVVPFYNATGRRHEGFAISSDLVAALRANGTYRVYDRRDIQERMGPGEYETMLGESAKEMAGRLHRLLGVQAVLSGTVTVFSRQSKRERRVEEIVVWDDAAGAYVRTGRYRSYRFTHNEAEVQLTANLFGTPDARPLGATRGAVRGRRVSEGSPPQMDSHACLAGAADDVIRQLVAEFAIAHVQVAIHPKKDIQIARGQTDGEWDTTGKFEHDEAEMFVVVRLPADCDRNRFRITVARKGDERELAETEFVWDRGWTTRGFRLDLKEIAAKGGGPGKYEVRFFYGYEHLVTRGFTLQEPGED